MRAFYALLAALVVVSRTDSASAVSHEKSSRLILPNEKITRDGQKNDIRSRYLKGDDDEATEEDADRFMSNLASLDEPTLDAVYKKFDELFPTQQAYDLIDDTKLDEFLEPENVPAFLNAKTPNQYLDVKKLNALVDPEKLDVVAHWDKKDSRGLATYFDTKLFPDFEDRGVDPGVVAIAMLKRGGFSDKFIQNCEDRYTLFLEL